MTPVAAVVSSSELLTVMAVAVVVVQLKQLDTLHVDSPSSCSHRREPVPLESLVLHAHAQVYHSY
jgi:hypothetical protein